MSQGYLFGNKISGDASQNKIGPFQIGRVKSIVLGPTLSGTSIPDRNYQSSADIGKITYELMYSPLGTSLSDAVSEPAYPIYGFIKQYPLIGEIVMIIMGPSPGLNDKYNKQQQYYFPPYALWNDAHHNAFPNLSEVGKFLNNFSNRPGYTNRVTRALTRFPLGSTFVEKKSIKNLRPFEGDSVIQSRFGQSIRFGSTSATNREHNTWSNSGNNGDPITIILNQMGQRPDIRDFDPAVENINRDGSAIYMTSTQEIFLEAINSFPLNSFGRSVDPITQPVYTSTELPTSNYGVSAADQDTSTLQSYNGG